MSHPTTGRRVRRGAVTAALLLVVPLALPAAASAAGAPASTTGAVGTVTVEPSEGLPVEGAEVVVRGTGFDPSSGVYVAVCVDNGPGEKPTPCIGGADTEGVGGAIWISDTPPSYAEGLTQPYGPGGSFEVTLPVPVEDPVSGTDCREVQCAVTVRFDHLRADDRSADHVIPVTFATEDGAADDADDAAATEEPSAEPTPTATPTDGEEPTAEPTVAIGAESTGSDDGGMNLALVGGLIALVVGGGLALAVALGVARRSRTSTEDDDAPSSDRSPDPDPDA